MGLLFPSPGEAVRAVPQRKNPEGNGLGPLRACKAGIHFSPSTNGNGDTSREGKVNSDIHSGASRRATLGREQRRAGLKIYFSPHSYEISS